MAEEKKTLKKVLRYIRKYLWLMILSMILAAVTVIFTLYLPILTGQAVDMKKLAFKFEEE